MSVEKVKEYLKKFGADGRVLVFDTSSATVELAAAALGCESARIAKTISLRHGDGCILVVAAGDAKIDNHKFKLRFCEKASMLPADEVEKIVGYAVGGVCPFGVNEGVEVYLDESLRRFSDTTVFPACGSSDSAIELTLGELEKMACLAGWVDVCKLPV